MIIPFYFQLLNSWFLVQVTNRTKIGFQFNVFEIKHDNAIYQYLQSAPSKESEAIKYLHKSTRVPSLIGTTILISIEDFLPCLKRTFPLSEQYIFIIKLNMSFNFLKWFLNIKNKINSIPLKILSKKPIIDLYVNNLKNRNNNLQIF